LASILGDGAVSTANSADLRLTAFISSNAPDVSSVADGEWMEIAPYGDFLSPDGSYVQKFHKEQAEKVVATWNSVTGVFSRLCKNMWHRLGRKTSVPVWDGHPDGDALRWPKESLLAEVTDLRAGATALEGMVSWNTANAARTRGPLYPSPKWWHYPPSGNPRAVYPELLESIGLVPTPNIKSVAAWTANQALDPFASADGSASQEAEAAATVNSQNQTKNHMKKFAIALGLAETATETEIDAALMALRNTANSGSGLLSTANATIATLTTERDTAATALSTANAQLAERNTTIGALTTERDGLLGEKGALTTANAALIAGILDVAEKRGLITPAQRPGFLTRLSTANTAADAITELKEGKRKLNVDPVEINGARFDLTTANSRGDAFQAAVRQRMTANKEEYDVAFAGVMKDPKYAPLIAAMSPQKV